MKTIMVVMHTNEIIDLGDLRNRVKAAARTIQSQDQDLVYYGNL